MVSNITEYHYEDTTYIKATNELTQSQSIHCHLFISGKGHIITDFFLNICVLSQRITIFFMFKLADRCEIFRDSFLSIMFSIFAAFREVRQFEQTIIAIYNLIMTKCHTDIVF